MPIDAPTPPPPSPPPPPQPSSSTAALDGTGSRDAPRPRAVGVRGARFWVIVALLFVGGYAVSYLSLRASGALIHGTVIHNEREGSHLIRPARTALAEHALWLFTPVAVLELHYWYWKEPFSGSPYRHYPGVWIDVDECNGLGLASRSTAELHR